MAYCEEGLTVGLFSPFLKKSILPSSANLANPANWSNQTEVGLAGLAAGGKSEICTDLLPPAWFPKASPSIVKEEPFGLDQPPPLLKAAWLRLLEGCPEGVKPVTREMAVFDLALLFGDWGKLITDWRWTAGDVFDYPAGLAWSIKGSPVIAIGKGMAMTRDERIWKRQG